ncbi:amino acid ABC transporter permease [Streptococcus suis]
MDWNFIQESIPLYQEAFILTIRLAFLGIIGAFSLGLIISIIHYYRIPLLQQITTAYVELSRNTPLVIQLSFLYYGLPRLGIVLDAEVCAIAGLIFLGGSYMAESFRSGFEAIKKSQIEIGASLGLTNWQIFQYILLPQSLAIALPSFSANIIFLMGTSKNICDFCSQLLYSSIRTRINHLSILLFPEHRNRSAIPSIYFSNFSSIFETFESPLSFPPKDNVSVACFILFSYLLYK